MSVRGDVTAKLGGKEYRLLLTLGAMAAIEEALEVDNIETAIGKAANQNARAILVMVRETAKAGGNPLSDEEVSALDYLEASGALGELINKAFDRPSSDEVQDETGSEKN
jgi:hypothetical protein